MSTSWLLPQSSLAYPFTQDPSLAPNDNRASSNKDKIQQSSHDSHLASFVFLVSGLEKTLRDDSSLLFDEAGTGLGKTTFKQLRTFIGSGASFVVEKAEWNRRSGIGLDISHESKAGKVIALKYVKRNVVDQIDGDANAVKNWNAVLLEIRALLHEPIRYHPNIVRLLGLSWGAAEGARSSFPVLAFEYAEFGSLSAFQLSNPALHNKTKRKLCHDVSKGISILHACGIVHGDVKHDNVLVFRNKVTDSEIIYTAKIADFGGAIMTSDNGAPKSLQMWTPPYNAPDGKLSLDVEALKRTDVYSFGLLIWRIFLDGQSPFELLPEIAELAPMELQQYKLDDKLLPLAKESIRSHCASIGRDAILSDDNEELLNFTLDNSIQAASERRDLVNVLAALQVKSLSEVEPLIREVQQKNEQRRIQDENEAPGQHGITQDGLGLYLARTDYRDHDFQKEGPGARPTLNSPDPAEFLFQPERLKNILDWSVQSGIVRDLKVAATTAATKTSSTQIPKVMAAFNLFRCYVHEFGVTFDPEQACYWLRQAALSNDECMENYLAQAWCWRVHRALDITLHDVSLSTLRDWMRLSIIRGHRQCIAEADIIISLTDSNDEKKNWRDAISLSTSFLRKLTANGMPIFLPRQMRRDYNLDDLEELDIAIAQEFSVRNIDSIDMIYVNQRGDGLLNYAAGIGNLTSLKHLVENYKPNINIYNKAKEETALLYACRGGHLDCALYLLEKGANPDGCEWCAETPLYWLSPFTDSEIPIIARKLVEAGASLQVDEKQRKHRRIWRPIWSDPEELFNLPVSPLSRAVMMGSMAAVKVLLELGADPWEGKEDRSSTCPIVLASVFTLPRFLEVMFAHTDAKPSFQSSPMSSLSEMEILQIAIDKIATIVDPTSLQSRLTRHGPGYRSAMFETLQILHSREDRLQSMGISISGVESKSQASNTVLARMVSLGRTDVVEFLLRLGHSVHGAPDACPIVDAVKLNHEPIFRLLVTYGADLTTKYPSSSGEFQSLLQVLADRPTHSRPGTFIADYLIRMGRANSDAGVDPPVGLGSRSAFAYAVKNQDFALADLLKKNGADVNFAYKYHPSGSGWFTILGELASPGCTPSEKNVASIRYLLGLYDGSETTDNVDPVSLAPGSSVIETLLSSSADRAITTGEPTSLPNFIIDKQNNISILHYASTVVPKSHFESSSFTQMLSCILSSPITTPEGINLMQPALGTALSISITLAQVETVSALLEKGADSNIPWRGMSPLNMAIMWLERANQNPDGLDKLKRDERRRAYAVIVELLKNSGAVL